MASRDAIDVGQRMELVVRTPASGGRFRARVILVGKDRLTVDCVSLDENATLPPDGSIVKCTFMTPSGQRSFESRVLGSTRDPQLILAAPHEVQHSQRRQFVRVPDRIPMTFRFETGEPEPVAVVAKCVTKDISGGGLSAKVERMSPSVLPTRGTVGRVELTLKGQDAPLRCASSVVRVVTNEETQKIEICLQFIEMPEEQRGRVMQYVFRREAERRVRS